VLDDSFDPSSSEAQSFLLNYCESFFAEDFAEPIENNYTCPINVFDAWLGDQAASDVPDEGYVEFCGAATGMVSSGMI
jgi:hypothetical protein